MSGIFQHFKDGKSNDFEFNVVRETELVFGDGLHVHMDDWDVFCMFRNMIKKANGEAELKRLHAIADRISKQPDLQTFLNKLTLIHPGAQQNVEALEHAEKFWKEHPTWWEQNVEAQFQAMSDEFRNKIRGNSQLTAFDITVGFGKGVYHFGKDVVDGVIGIVMYSKDFFTNEKTRQDAWDLTKRFSWWFFRINSPIASWREEAARETAVLVQTMYEAVASSVKTDWAKAVEEGKEDELIAKWTTQGILELATVVLSAVKATKAGKVAKAFRATKKLKANPPKVSKLLMQNVSALDKSVGRQKKLFKAARATALRAKDEMTDAVRGIKGAEVISIPKRNNLAGFVNGVIEKNQRVTKWRGPFATMDEMTDMSRGRVNVDNLEDMKEVVRRIRKQAKGRVVQDSEDLSPPYPRRHIVVRDAATGMKHEWQIGTKATTEFYEQTKIEMPKGLNISGNPDFHDLIYDRLEPFANAVKDGEIDIPGMKNYLEEIGVYKLLDDYIPVMWETRNGKFPGLDEKRFQLRDRLQTIIHRLHKDHRGTIETMSHK